MRYLVFLPLVLLSACAAQQPEPQTAAVDALVEELNLIPPPTKVVIKTNCADVSSCIESGRAYNHKRDR